MAGRSVIATLLFFLQCIKMDSILNIRKVRESFLKIIEAIPNDRLNEIPKGFNNNLIWNFGHVIVTQQQLCYSLSGLDTHVSEAMIHTYRKGTRPEEDVSEDEVDELKVLAQDTVIRLENDMHDKVFKNYRKYPTQLGMVLHNFDEALVFNSMHESLHLGYAMAMLKFLDK